MNWLNTILGVHNAKKKAEILMDAVERKISEDGWEALRRLLCAMIRHRELRSLAEEIIQEERLTQGYNKQSFLNV